MTRSRTGSSDKPLPVRLASWLYRASASLELAVVLISVYAIVLAWATFVESWYGTPAVHFGIYRTWWFILLNLLLGLNVLAAALIRFPWNRRQTGFLVTHLGILVLLAGSTVSHLKGVDSQLIIIEGDASRRAYQSTQHFALQIRPKQDRNADSATESEPIVVPFYAGPFNWEDYGQMWWFPWKLAHRSRGLIYDRDGITLEVLDYCSDSRRFPLPRITLKVDSDAQPTPDRPSSAGPAEITLAVGVPTADWAGSDPHATQRRFGVGEQKATPQGDRVVFWMSGSRAETDAFLHARPEGPLGELGQVVLYAGGQTFRFGVDQWQKKPRQSLGDTALEVELLRVNTMMRGVQIAVHRRDDPPQPMTLYATLPHLSRQDDRHGVYGSYWIDPHAAPAEPNRSQVAEQMFRQASRPRIDIIQGHDQRLYYRTWLAPQLGTSAPWPTQAPGATAAVGTRVVAFRHSDRPIVLTLEEFVPRSEPGGEIRPLPFEKEDQKQLTSQRRARLRLSVDGESEEFWLAASIGESLPDEQHQVESEDRSVSIGLAHDYIDLGFQVFLHDFQRKLDPGTARASHYSSLVDFVDGKDATKRLERKILITMNQPADFTDPESRRSYRLFQSGWREPWKPGDPVYQHVASEENPRHMVYRSVISVNHDPGRGLKYAGSMLICLGILVIYYMKAYFFRRRTVGA